MFIQQFVCSNKYWRMKSFWAQYVDVYKCSKNCSLHLVWCPSFVGRWKRKFNKFIYIQCYVLSHSFALYMCGCFSKTLDTKLQKWSIYRKYADKTANATLNNTFYWLVSVKLIFWCTKNRFSLSMCSNVSAQTVDCCGYHLLLFSLCYGEHTNFMGANQNTPEPKMKTAAKLPQSSKICIHTIYILTQLQSRQKMRRKKTTQQQKT